MITIRDDGYGMSFHLNYDDVVQQGYEAGMAGDNDCPHMSTRLITAWRQGYKKAKEEDNAKRNTRRKMLYEADESW